MIQEAVVYATKIHAVQTRKGTQIPYILHPMEVAAIASRMKLDDNLICAAILHDTIEDGNIKKSDLAEAFNIRIAALVAALSEDKTQPWALRKRHTLDVLSKENDEDILIVALADKLSNMRSIERDYMDLGEQLWHRFSVTEKQSHGWYYKGMLQSLKSLKDTPEYRELSELVGRVFG